MFKEKLQFNIESIKEVYEMKVEGYEIKEGLYYTATHEWASVDGTKIRIGLSDFAQKSLHEIVFVELPHKGAKVAQKSSIGTVESVKAVSEVFSPVSGEIVEVNEKLLDKPELINEKPYEEGWVAVIRADEIHADLKNLMNTEKYVHHVKEEVKKH
jgi:glycine cleavage system H protein